MLYDTVDVVTYYEREDGVYIPVTRRVNSDLSVESLLDNMYMEVSVGSDLEVPSILSTFSILGVSSNEDGIIVEVNEQALYDELSIKDDVYEIVMLTLNELNDLDVNVSFVYDGETMQVCGYEKAVTVNGIYYNDLKI